MSRIYFHAQNDEAEVRGPERAYAGALCGDLFLSALGVSRWISDRDIGRYLTLFPADHYLHRLTGDAHQLGRSISTAIEVGGEFFTPILNTALVMGSDAVKLLARLHGQCEIHTYVEGEHRAWLADIIERGRATGVLRAEMGWEGVIILLRAADDAPVVTSYSVCEQFPNAGVAGWSDDHDGDDWYELPGDEQWSRALAGLRASKWLQLKPDAWETFYFEDGTTAFDLLQKVQAVGAT